MIESAMHGVRRILLEQQAESVGVPLRKILIPKTCTNESMSDLWQRKWSSSNGRCFSGCLWRHFSARPQGLPGAESYKSRDERVFPVWKRNSRELVECFINLRFKSIVTTCDPRVVGEKFCGRIINKRFLTELPTTVDPAGENGEYHSFAFDGPIFKQSVRSMWVKKCSGMVSGSATWCHLNKSANKNQSSMIIS